jgi:small-conductance mechanosensitive channel
MAQAMAHSPASAPESLVTGLKTEQRISWLTLLIGITASAFVLVLRLVNWAEGLFLGTLLAWLNFRWLRRGLNALVVGSVAQQDLPKPKVPLITYFTSAFRYGLLALAVYAIFAYLHVPLLSLILGLCALGAAATVGSVWEILHPAD